MTTDHEFSWGVATASYQIEGGSAPDLRGRSVWDHHCAVPGRIHDGSSGEIACDHFHRMEEDVALMERLGVDAYRFSVAWPRVMPAGEGAVSEAGLAFYDRLVDRLLEAGITPWITLFHWDFPLELYRRGGWLSPESPRWFEAYTEALVRGLSDRVRHWMTLNEPQCFVGLGHAVGRHAPGLRLPGRDVLRVGRHALLAHGRAVRAIREHARREASVGWASLAHVCVPASDRAEDVEAARAETFAVPAGDEWIWSLSWFGDPIHLGRLPEAGLARFGADAPRFTAGDLELISTPVDFTGLNIYSGSRVRAGVDGRPERLAHGPGHAHTTMDWALVPEALRWGPAFAHGRYGLPVAITENGMGCHDWVSLDGAVHDPQRIDYLARYLGELDAARARGVPVIGYFLWTLLDNFEWAEGYRKRFGLVHVDFETLERTPKDSFRWYAERIRSARAGAPIGAVKG
jgi:beta-glucosidase